MAQINYDWICLTTGKISSLSQSNSRQLEAKMDPVRFWMTNLSFHSQTGHLFLFPSGYFSHIVANVLTSLGMVSSWVLAWLLASRPAAGHRESDRKRGGKEIEFGTLREVNRQCSTALQSWSFFFNPWFMTSSPLLCHWKVWLSPEQSLYEITVTTTWIYSY